MISLLIIWGVLTITFVIIHLSPGDPMSIYVRPEIDPAVVENIRDAYGLDAPLWQQYFNWFGQYMQGDFSFSFSYHKPVVKLFAENLPQTLGLTLSVLITQFIIGIFIGLSSAIHNGKRFEKIVNGILLFLYSMPGFWLALLAILFFSKYLGWLPASQISDWQAKSGMAGFWDLIKHAILPVLVLAIPFSVSTARFVKEKYLELLASPFYAAAVASGLPDYKIKYKYGLKFAALPLFTLVGLYLPFILGGAVIIEYIFAWPGMGSITVNAIFAHDFPVIIASNFVAAFSVVAGNLLSDVSYALIDPRIRF